MAQLDADGYPKEAVARPCRFPETAALLDRLVRTQTRSEAVHRALSSALAHVGRSEDLEDLDYLPPPHEDDNDELRMEIQNRRKRIPRRHRETVRLFDEYHRARHVMNSAIEEARLAIDASALEIDRGATSPFEMPTTKLSEILNRIRGSLASTFTLGPYPTMNTQENLDALAGAIRRLSDWIEVLRPITALRGRGPDFTTEVRAGTPPLVERLTALMLDRKRAGLPHRPPVKEAITKLGCSISALYQGEPGKLWKAWGQMQVTGLHAERTRVSKGSHSGRVDAERRKADHRFSSDR